ncbi:hypothetical protein WSM22_30380 [Cytophagales bacterium WSM2-2]|nr:hypothetical protein WSM22_30380 [Cytophagales bacterium WSM2-2]
MSSSRQFFVIITLFITTFSLSAQTNSVAIGAATADPDAVLLLVANGNQGLVIPKVNLSTAPAAFGKAGMIVYNTNDNKVYYYDGATSAWKTIGGTGTAAGGIAINGNTVSLGGTQTSFNLATPTPAGSDQGKLLVWDGTKWSTTPKPTTTDQILKWDNTNGVWLLGTITGGGSPTLANNQIFVGNASGVATAVPMSGDATINNTGNITLANTAAARTNLGLGSLATLNSPAFGSQNISTTGNLSAGVATLTGLTISGAGTLLNSVGYTWPSAQGAANSVLTNNGTGTLSWTAGTSLPALTANQLFSNNGSNTGITVGGDLSLAVTGTAGAFTIANNAVTSTKILDGTIANADISATAAIAGSKITPAFVAQNISTTGTLTTGAATITGLTVSGNSTSLNTVGYTWPGAQGTANTVLTNNGTGTLSWTPGLTATLAQNNIFVGNATNVATAVAMSNDATIASSGALTIANNAITSAKINDGTIADADISATAAIAGSKITPAFVAQNISTTGTLTTGAATVTGLTVSGNSTSLNTVGYTWPAAQGAASTVLTNNGTGTLSWTLGLTATLAQNNIFVGNATNVATAVAMSNDATIASNGALTIANNAITSAKINDGTIADADISATAAIAGSKITPAFVAQNISTTGTLTTGAATVTGLTVSGTSTSFNTVGYTWPGAQGAVNTMLTNNGTGTLSWTPGLTATLAQNNIFVGNATNVATAVAMSNDATIASNGALTIANNAITSAKINDGTIADADISATAAIAGSKITPAFVAQNISTTGTLTTGAATVTGLTVSGNSTSLNTVGYTWPAAQGAASTVLTNNGTGTLSWVTAAGGWGLTGNAGTADGTNFIGTTDNVPLSFKVNNQNSGRIDHLLSNVFLGFKAGNTSTGLSNTALGHNAMLQSTSGAFNTAVGNGSMNLNTTGNFNTALGSGTLFSNIVGTNNTAIGMAALNSNIVSDNTAVGANAMKSNTDGANNTAVGSGALTNNFNGSNNTGIGKDALKNNVNDNNTAVGSSALFNNNDGFDNTAVGKGALQNNITDAANQNTAVGSNALNGNSIGASNTSVGVKSMLANTTGSLNTAVGLQAMVANNTGTFNTAIGFNSMVGNTGGTNNTALGVFAMSTNTTGTFNTAVGYNADISGTNLTNATAIGANAVVNASNKIILGNNSVTSIGGFAGFSNFSDRRLKENIVYTNNLGLNFIMQLKPATYNYIKDQNKRSRNGLIAQDVQKTLSDLGINFSGLIVDDDSAKTLSLSYSEFVLPLITAAQEQQTVIEQLKKELKESNERFQAKISALENNQSQQSQLDELKSANKKLEQRLAAFEEMLSKNTGSASVKAEKP